MRRLSAIFQSRAFGRIRQPGVEISVDRFSFTVDGGCWDAQLTCESESTWELFDLCNRLRQPVTIRDDRGEPIWWGFVNEVLVSVGGVQIGVSLDSMSNSVVVAYSKLEAGSNGAGERETTAPATYALSVSEYGTKEKVAGLSSATDSRAEAYRDTVLDALKVPLAVIGEGDQAGATINLKGWWQTLAWRYYTSAAGREVYEDLGNAAVQALGDSASNEKVAQSFELEVAGTWLVGQVDLHIKKVGAPVDNVTVAIYSDSGGAPDTLLATSDAIGGADIPDSLSWVGFVFSTYYEITDSTTYWLVIERSGGADGSNYYNVDANEDTGYTRGVFRIYNGAAWGARTPDADMPFRVLGIRETNDLIEAVLDEVGEFFPSVTISATGVYDGMYRDGDQLAMDVVTELLQSGNSSNKRLLVDVTMSRHVMVYPEPARGSAPELFLTGDRKVLDRTLSPVLTSPVGKWIELKDVIPSNVDLVLIADPKWSFVERAEFDVAQDEWRLEFRGSDSPWGVGEVSDG